MFQITTLVGECEDVSDQACGEDVGTGRAAADLLLLPGE